MKRQSGNSVWTLSMLLSVIYYTGRVGQVLGMWLLVVDIVMAGPLGPSPRMFAVGVAVFLAGWGLTRFRGKAPP